MSEEDQTKQLKEPLLGGDSEEPKAYVPIAGKDKITTFAMLTLAGGFVLEVLIGTQFAWGNISTYVTGYYRDEGAEVRNNDFYSVLPLIVVFSTITFPFGMAFADKYGPKLIFTCGGILGIVSTLLASSQTNPWVFFWVYSMGFGICKGCLYPCALIAAWTHLPARKGLASGIIVSGMGVGAFIFGIVTQKIANPDNIKVVHQQVGTEPDGEAIMDSYFPPEVNARVPFMFKVLCIIWACQIAFAFITITTFHKDQVEAGAESHDSKAAATTREQWAEEQIGVAQLLGSKEFIVLYINFVCFIFYGYYVINVFKLYGQEFLENDRALTYVGSVGALVNGVLRIVWSTLLDYYSFRVVFGTLVFLQMTLTWLIQIQPTNMWLYLVIVCASMQCEGAVASILPTTSLQVFGMHKGHLVYSYMFSAFGVSSLAGGVLVKWVQDYIGYRGMFIFSFALTVMAFIITLWFGDKKFDYVEAVGEEKMKEFDDRKNNDAENKAE